MRILIKIFYFSVGAVFFVFAVAAIYAGKVPAFSESGKKYGDVIKTDNPYWFWCFVAFFVITGVVSIWKGLKSSD